MPEVIAKQVLSWATDLDFKTIEQARQSASLPFIEGHVALMPDAHFGYGATVGSVIPTKGAIIPSAIGVDIGCGMIAGALSIATDKGLVSMYAEDLPDDLQPLHSRIAKVVPAGVGQGHELGSGPAGEPRHFPRFPITEDNWKQGWAKKAYTQFGSLGSGNHFIEICLDETDRVWIVLHSGSRGIGNVLANMHIDGAKRRMKDYFIQLPHEDLSYLVEDTPDFNRYIADMRWAQDYAMGNREVMLEAVLGEVNHFLGAPVVIHHGDRINCHHNFTEREHHRGTNVWLTRKGAIRAREGDRGVIPGSMGARTYIVRGLGNKSSYHSCSHGAGRRMSRAQAKRELDRETLLEQMKGIAWNGDTESLIDEDPRAYKDIDVVMANQADLVEVEHTLHQILNYKGV